MNKSAEEAIAYVPKNFKKQKLIFGYFRIQEVILLTCLFLSMLSTIIFLFYINWVILALILFFNSLILSFLLLPDILYGFLFLNLKKKISYLVSPKTFYRREWDDRVVQNENKKEG